VVVGPRRPGRSQETASAPATPFDPLCRSARAATQPRSRGAAATSDGVNERHRNAGSLRCRALRGQRPWPTSDRRPRRQDPPDSNLCPSLSSSRPPHLRPADALGEPTRSLRVRSEIRGSSFADRAGLGIRELHLTDSEPGHLSDTVARLVLVQTDPERTASRSRWDAANNFEPGLPHRDKAGRVLRSTRVGDRYPRDAFVSLRSAARWVVRRANSGPARSTTRPSPHGFRSARIDSAIRGLELR